MIGLNRHIYQNVNKQTLVRSFVVAWSLRDQKQKQTLGERTFVTSDLCQHKSETWKDRLRPPFFSRVITWQIWLINVKWQIQGWSLSFLLLISHVAVCFVLYSHTVTRSISGGLVLTLRRDFPHPVGLRFKRSLSIFFSFLFSLSFFQGAGHT